MDRKRVGDLMLSLDEYATVPAEATIREALLALDKAVPRLDAVAHHLGMASQQGPENEVLGGVADQVADIADELHSVSDRDRLREWGNEIDAPGKAH